MKKLLTFLGAAFVLMVVVIVVAAAIFIPRALKLNREATAYIQDAVPRIVANWNSHELVDRATPELLGSAASRDEIDRCFVMFRQLGSLKHIDTPTGTVMSSTFTGSGTVTIGNYMARAEFEKGPAIIKIQLRRVNETWKINGFRINSDVFLPQKT